MAQRETPSAAGAGTIDLPPVLRTYMRVGPAGLVVGTLLCLLALLTNPVPDPSFAWFTLPPSLRLPVTQPRIEHWPVSYTLGIWLWVAGFPAIFLALYRRYGPERSTLLLAGLPATAMLAWTTYCRFFWPKLYPPTWNAPSYTQACWLYCSSYAPLWSNLAYAIAGLGLVAYVLAERGSRPGTYGLAAFGLLAFPLGLPALFEAYRRTRAAA